MGSVRVVQGEMLGEGDGQKGGDEYRFIWTCKKGYGRGGREDSGNALDD